MGWGRERGGAFEKPNLCQIFACWRKSSRYTAGERHFYFFKCTIVSEIKSSIFQIWLLAGKRIHAFVHLQICIFRFIEEKKNIFQSVAIENENASLSIVGCGFGISVLHSLDHRSPSTRASLLSSLSFGLARFFSELFTSFQISNPYL